MNLKLIFNSVSSNFLKKNFTVTFNYKIQIVSFTPHNENITIFLYSRYISLFFKALKSETHIYNQLNATKNLNPYFL